MPSCYAEELAPLLEQGYVAEVAGREGGVFIVEAGPALAAEEPAEVVLGNTLGVRAAEEEEAIGFEAACAQQADAEEPTEVYATESSEGLAAAHVVEGDGAETLAEADGESGANPVTESPAVEEGWPSPGKKKRPAWVIALVVLAAVVVIAVILALVVLGNVEATQSVCVVNVAYEVPESWTISELDVDDDDFGGIYKGIYADGFDGGVLVRAGMEAYPSFTEDNLPSLLAGFGIEDDPIDEYAYDDALVYLYEGELWSGDKKGYVQVVVSGGYGSIAVAWCATDEFDDYGAELKEILYGLYVVSPAAPSFS